MSLSSLFNYMFLLLIFLLLSCQEKNPNAVVTKQPTLPQKQIKQDFQTILDSAQVTGSILVYDPQKSMYYSNDFKWAETGHLPASTYKIPHSFIALETGVVENDSTLFEWNGEKRRLKIWEQDLIFKKAFHFSCVPCYQSIARKIGPNRMNQYLDSLDYGDMLVDSSNIDIFWLVGESKINQFQQIDFLQRFYQAKLPVSDRTQQIMKRLMVIEENDSYILSGKTGWSIRNDQNNGWFVGFVEKEEQVYFFATNVEPQEEFNMKMFPKIRKEITAKALKLLGIN